MCTEYTEYTDLNRLEPSAVVVAAISAQVAALVVVQAAVLLEPGLLGVVVTAEALVRVLHAEVRRLRLGGGTVPSANLRRNGAGKTGRLSFYTARPGARGRGGGVAEADAGASCILKSLRLSMVMVMVIVAVDGVVLWLWCMHFGHKH